MTAVARHTNLGELQLVTGEIEENRPDANPIKFVAQGTTNLLPSPSATCSSTSGWSSYYSGALATDSSQNWKRYGSSIKVTTLVGNGYTDGFISGWTASQPANTTLVGSLWTLIPAGVQIFFSFRTQNNGEAQGGVTVTGTGSWQQVIIGPYTPTFNDIWSLQGHETTDNASAITFWVDALMIEAQASSTPWTPSSRPNNSLLIGGEIEESMPVNNASISAVGATNLVPNPVALTGLTDISEQGSAGGAYTISQSSPIPSGISLKTGVYVSVTATGDNNVTWSNGASEGGNGIPVSPNTQYTFSCWVYSADGLQFGIRPIEWTSSGGVASDDAQTSLYTNAGGWQRISRTITTTSTTAMVSFRVYVGFSTGTGYITGVQIEQGTLSNFTLKSRPNNSLLLSSTLFEKATNAITGSIANPGWVNVPASASWNPSKITFMGRYKWDGVLGDPAASMDWASMFAVSTYNGPYGVLYHRAIGETNQAINFYVNGQALTYNFTSDGLEHHWAFVYDGATSYIYRDGVVVASGAFAPPSTGTAQPLYLLSNNNGGYPWGGSAREMSLWNNALTQAQIQQYMNQGSLHGTEANLVGYWRCTGTGSTILDGSSSKINGTAQGSLGRIFI